jgi:hypothetical protein
LSSSGLRRLAGLAAPLALALPASALAAPPGTPPTPLVHLDDTATERSWAWAEVPAWANVLPSQLHYQWRRAWPSGLSMDIPDATDADYQFTSVDVGAKVTVRVTAITPEGTGFGDSAEVGPILAGPPWTDRTPALWGTVAREGETITAVSPTWTAFLTPTLGYGWERCGTVCAAIPGATASSYLLTAADVGGRIRAWVTATNAVGSDTVRSGMTDVVTARPASPTPPNLQPLPIRTEPFNVAPNAKLAAPKRLPRLAAALKAGVPVDVHCAERCVVSGRLVVDAKVAKRLKLAKAGVVGSVAETSVKGGSTAHLKVRIDKAAARKLRRERRLTVTFSGTVEDVLGHSAPLQTRLTLKR